MGVAARLRAGARLPGGAELLVAAVALIPRLGLIVRSGGPRGNFGYDGPVYYTAADALLHGRAPYRDFVLLHPPGMALFLTPFAWLGELTSDHRGYILASFAFVALGAINAVLVTRIGLCFGFGRGAALVGGLFYAVWPGTADVEYTVSLETLGTTLMLCGLLAYQRSETSRGARWPVLSGAAMAAAATVKIWWVVPLLLLACWQLGPTRRARVPYYLAGAAAALIVVDGPFFALAPRTMWAMVVTDQVNRGGRVHTSTRLTGLTGIRLLNQAFALRHDVLIVAVATVLLLAIIALALRHARGALPVALLVATLGVLLASPTWFGHYDGLMAPGLALTSAAAAATLGASPPLRSPALRRGTAGVAAAAAVAMLLAATASPQPPIRPYPGAKFAHAVRHLHCVMSDSPMSLIEMNVLSRDLRNGCRNWVDVTGRTYQKGGPGGNLYARRTDLRWQHELVRYLSSGQAFTVDRGSFTGIGGPLRGLMHRHRVLAHGNGHKLYAS